MTKYQVNTEDYKNIHIQLTLYFVMLQIQSTLYFTEILFEKN